MTSPLKVLYKRNLSTKEFRQKQSKAKQDTREARQVNKIINRTELVSQHKNQDDVHSNVSCHCDFFLQLMKIMKHNGCWRSFVFISTVIHNGSRSWY